MKRWGFLLAALLLVNATIAHDLYLMPVRFVLQGGALTHISHSLA